MVQTRFGIEYSSTGEQVSWFFVCPTLLKELAAFLRALQSYIFFVLQPKICFPLFQLQVDPSPEPTSELLPRLCHLLKGDNGYGFNLHNNKKKQGQFVRSVDPGSPAENADMRPGDRLVEVQ